MNQLKTNTMCQTLTLAATPSIKNMINCNQLQISMFNNNHGNEPKTKAGFHWFKYLRN